MQPTKKSGKKIRDHGITSPCIVHVFGSILAFSICSIFDWIFFSCISWVEGFPFFYTHEKKLEYESLVFLKKIFFGIIYINTERERERETGLSNSMSSSSPESSDSWSNWAFLFEPFSFSPLKKSSYLKATDEKMNPAYRWKTSKLVRNFKLLYN